MSPSREDRAPLAIRAVGVDERETLATIAERMRLTLMEVLGETRGADMYSLDWLRARVAWHLDPRECVGEVFVAERDGANVGHAIVRVDVDEAGLETGLFATFYVDPAARRMGVAVALLTRGEAWLIERGTRVLGTHTSATNTPLIALFEQHGYAITLEVPESQMVRLERRVHV